MRRDLIERDHPDLSIGQQCALLSIPRSSFYYAPQGETEQNLALMRLIDLQFLDTPFFGVRQMTWHLRNEGHAVNEKRIRRLMRLMGLMPIYQKPNTSKPAKGHKTYPYLLRGLRVERPNQVWCVDITYLPMRRGFLYLAAIMDWHTRMVLSWRISNTLDADFCVEALNEAIYRFGPPDIMNSDQGSQFTSFAWTDRLRRSGIRISMDGKGRYLDNIFIERLWRTLKYECVYHKLCATEPNDMRARSWRKSDHAAWFALIKAFRSLGSSILSKASDIAFSTFNFASGILLQSLCT